jgi:hypothetical protein
MKYGQIKPLSERAFAALSECAFRSGIQRRAAMIGMTIAPDSARDAIREKRRLELIARFFKTRRHAQAAVFRVEKALYPIGG